MHRSTTIRFCLLLAVFFGATSIVSNHCDAQTIRPEPIIQNDDLTPNATWAPATDEEILGKFEKWVGESKAIESSASRTGTFLESRLKNQSNSNLIDSIMESAAMVRPEINQIREELIAQRKGTRPPDFTNWLDNPNESKFLQDHIRLYYGRWLAQNEFYDEAIVQLDKLKIEDILDRPSLLFYRGLMEHQLLKKEKCLKTIGQLLEHSESLPKRFEVLSKLMLADMKPLETDSLDEISRIMNDIRRRTDLTRSGKIVLKREADVIKKLDKLIEELEAQQQSQPAADNVTPSRPMQDSFRAGGKGSGQVTNKRQVDGGDWGELPPADRAAALAEMAKDMPPHYRAVIEEYFKQLAKQNER